MHAVSYFTHSLYHLPRPYDDLRTKLKENQCFAFLNKGDNFHNFLFAFPHTEPFFLKLDATSKKIFVLRGIKFFPLSAHPYF